MKLKILAKTINGEKAIQSNISASLKLNRIERKLYTMNFKTETDNKTYLILEPLKKQLNNSVGMALMQVEIKNDFAEINAILDKDYTFEVLE